MENNLNFDELAKKFFDARGEETYCNLFGAAFAIPEWHFIVDGDVPNLSPYCAVFQDFFDGQPMVLVFTDKERLHKYIASQNLHTGLADKPIVLNSSEPSAKFPAENLILSIPTPSVVDYIEKLTEKGVKGVFFNPNKDSLGFHLGLTQLRETKDLIDSKKPPLSAAHIADKLNPSAGKIDFDALSRKSNESGGATNDLNNLFGETFELEKWMFIARGELPNLNPYIAANPDYADGQQMIRSFTDSDRLQRFAQANNLTDASGSAQVLEIPVSGIVEYLEQFINYGVHGVWFNSDAKSDGYFIPLKQLRPIKEYLAKIGWQSSITHKVIDILPQSEPVLSDSEQKSSENKMPMEVVFVMINDGLSLPSGFFKASNYACNFYCIVPQNWTENGKLKENYLERFFENFYGNSWRTGNSDGSSYIVDYSYTQVLTPEILKEYNITREFGWNFQNDEKNHYWLYIASENGGIVKSTPTEFHETYLLTQVT